MIKVNAVGQTCPIPIIMTKNALKDIEEGEVEVLVDNKISLENLQKMSKPIQTQIVVLVRQELVA